jgi:hypothetical protein
MVCGGLHPPAETHSLVEALAPGAIFGPERVLVFTSANPLDVLSAHALGTWLDQALSQAGLDTAELVIWSFSAGCVGSAALANHWHRHRTAVRSLFLVDGWGVPCPVGLPVHRLSHDRVTHLTSPTWGLTTTHFYGEPGVPHRQLWQAPQTVPGWQVGPGQSLVATNAADFLLAWSRVDGGLGVGPYQQLITHSPKMKAVNDSTD